MRRPLDVLVLRAAVAAGSLVLAIVVVCDVLAPRYGDAAVQVPWTVARVLAFCAGGLVLVGFVLKERRWRRMKGNKDDAGQK
jgi:hypothetical protein